MTDRTGALEMISLNLNNLSAVENFLADGGYSEKNFADSVKDIHGATIEIVKKSDLPEFTVIPKRWIV